MKRLLVVVLSVGFLFVATNAQAQFFKKIITGAGSTAPEGAARTGLTAAEKDVVMAKAIETLKSREWKVYLYNQRGKPTIVDTDVLSFTDLTIKSANLFAKGYNPSNFTPSVADDGRAIFETMMRAGPGKDLVYLRAELKGALLGGVISFRPVSGAKKIYNFATELPHEAVTATAAQTPKKK